MKVQNARSNHQTAASCRHTLRAAIKSRSRRRNWLQIGLCTFGLAGLATNVSATGGALGKTMLISATGALGFAKLAFLFFWLAAQVVIWLIGAGVLGRLVGGRALTMREAAEDVLVRS